MADKIEKPAEEAVKYMGADAIKTVTSEGIVKIKVKQDAYKAMLEREGITPEVVKHVSEGIQKIQASAIAEAKDICKKHKGATVKVVLGSPTAPFAQEIKFIGKRERNQYNNITKTTDHVVDYGVVQASILMPWGKELKGEDGALKKYQDEMDNFFNKKK